MTWKASAASPPNATGSTSGSITLWNSTIEPGQPCVISNGSAPSCGERWWTKWMSTSVDRGDELVEAVERCLAAAPVVPVGPVRGDVLHVGERDALRPVVHVLTIRPACVLQPHAQVVEYRFRHVDREWTDLVGHRSIVSDRRNPWRARARHPAGAWHRCSRGERRRSRRANRRTIPLVHDVRRHPRHVRVRRPPQSRGVLAQHVLHVAERRGEPRGVPRRRGRATSTASRSRPSNARRCSSANGCACSSWAATSTTRSSSLPATA